MTFPNNSVIAASGWNKQDIYLSRKTFLPYSSFEKGCTKKCACDNPESNMGYDQYTVPDTVAVVPTFVAFLYHSQT